MGSQVEPGLKKISDFMMVTRKEAPWKEDNQTKKPYEMICFLYLLSVLATVISVTVGPNVEVIQDVL